MAVNTYTPTAHAAYTAGCSYRHFPAELGRAIHTREHEINEY